MVHSEEYFLRESGFLQAFLNNCEQLQLRLERLLISRFQVRVLGGSLGKCLQMLRKRKSPGSGLGLSCINGASTRSIEGYLKASSIASAIPPSMPLRT